MIGGLESNGDTMDESTKTVPVDRTRSAPMARIGLVGAAAAAIVAVGILAAGATATPRGTLAAGTEAAVTTIAGEVLPLDDAGRELTRRGFREITITAISGSSISLATADGWTRTITVDGGTTYSESGASISLSDLAVGDEIQFGQTRETDGSYTIDAIVVIPPHAGGAVTAISGSTITVQRRDGSTATIKVTSTTTYNVNGTDGAALGDVEVGMLLVAEGTESSDGSLTATAVRAATPGSMPGPAGHGFRGPGGHGPWDDGGAPEHPPTPGSTSGSAG